MRTVHDPKLPVKESAFLVGAGALWVAHALVMILCSIAVGVSGMWALFTWSSDVLFVMLRIGIVWLVLFGLGFLWQRIVKRRWKQVRGKWVSYDKELKARRIKDFEPQYLTLPKN